MFLNFCHYLVIKLCMLIKHLSGLNMSCLHLACLVSRSNSILHRGSVNFRHLLTRSLVSLDFTNHQMQSSDWLQTCVASCLANDYCMISHEEILWVTINPIKYIKNYTSSSSIHTYIVHAYVAPDDEKVEHQSSEHNM